MTTRHRHRWAVAAVLATALLAWDASGLDLAAAAAFGGPAGFPLKGDWLLTEVAHDGGRLVSWALLLALVLMVWWPIGVFARIDFARRLQLVLGTLAAVALVTALKATSHTSCPWDLADFGRAARHVSHWAWTVSDGGSGHCFPAGHASSGFAFIGGYLVFADAAPRVARTWLAVALLAGLGLGLAQQMRGAHFMSHTLWTAWLCWCVALIAHQLRAATDGRRAAAGEAAL